MKNWLLYFFAVTFCVTLIPLSAANSPSVNKIPKITLYENGETTEIDIEEYALRVLLAESKICESGEAKKALAVSARSAAFYISVFGLKHSDFDVCSDKNCCIPLGDKENADKAFLEECLSAVRETEGVVLYDGELPSMALFTLCAGSGTRQCEEFGYLISVSEKEACEIHKAEKTIEFSALPFGKTVLYENSCIVYGENRKCDFGVFGGKMYSGDELCAILGLNSTEFILTTTDAGIKAEAIGAGNGYGLSLCGAERMAKSNFTYEKIIEFYFPRLLLKKIYSN